MLAVVIQVFLALLCGVATAYQPGLNAKFAEYAGSRIHGGGLNFAVGLVTMLVVAAVLRAGVPDFQRLAQGPWWMWIGGCFGAFFVTLSLILVPKMGTASYLAAMLAGQFAAALVIDHYGHLGLTPSPLTARKLVGIGLIVAGVFCLTGVKRPPAPDAPATAS